MVIFRSEMSNVCVCYSITYRSDSLTCEFGKGLIRMPHMRRATP